MKFHAAALLPQLLHLQKKPRPGWKAKGFPRNTATSKQTHPPRRSFAAGRA